jgi:AcrR family transcriptional regulator
LLFTRQLLSNFRKTSSVVFLGKRRFPAYPGSMPISDCEVRDPRIRRTRQLLQGALRTLLQTKSFDGLAVQDIADAATVNRATFYDHYTDKFALLEAMVAGEFHQLLHERDVQFDRRSAAATAPLVLDACDFLTRCSGKAGHQHARHAFEPLIDAAITSAIRRVLIAGMAKPGRNHHVSSEMIATAASWAIYGAVKEWSQTRHRPPAEAIVPTIVQMVEPLLAPVCPQPARVRSRKSS